METQTLEKRGWPRDRKRLVSELVAGHEENFTGRVHGTQFTPGSPPLSLRKAGQEGGRYVILSTCPAESSER